MPDDIKPDPFPAARDEDVAGVRPATPPAPPLREVAPESEVRGGPEAPGEELLPPLAQV